MRDCLRSRLHGHFAVAFPTDAKLMRRARERLLKLAKRTGVELAGQRERWLSARSPRIGYAHAKQFIRATGIVISSEPLSDVNLHDILLHGSLEKR